MIQFASNQVIPKLTIIRVRVLLGGGRNSRVFPAASQKVFFSSPHPQLFLQSVALEGVALKKMPSHRALQLPGLKEPSLLDVLIQSFAIYVADAGRGTVDVLTVVGSRSRQDLVPEGQVLKLKVCLKVDDQID